MEKSSILEMARGAIMEQVDTEVCKIVDNIIDLNTEAKKKRQLVLTVDFIPSADRDVVQIAAVAKSKLQPFNAVQTALYVGVNSKTGEVVATEMTPNVPGQVDFEGDEAEEPRELKITRKAV